MKLLIASVHKGLNWYNIQRKFIQSNTNDYDYVIYLNGTAQPNDNVIFQNKTPSEARLEHMRGVQYILNYFNDNLKYDYCLLLDSDAFPIKPWNCLLQHDVSCVVRYENLDTWPHPCVFLFNRQAKFEIAFDQIDNMLGYKCDEFNIKIHGDYFPLIRTNRYNPHPIISGIYYNTFYHHGAGSRSFYNRAIHINQYYDDPHNEKVLYDKIMSKPEEYIKTLC